MGNQEIKPENPSAFPVPPENMREFGMTLRDYFAGKAMQGALSSGLIVKSLNNSELAEQFYGLADAMLLERSHS